MAHAYLQQPNKLAVHLHTAHYEESLILYRYTYIQVPRAAHNQIVAGTFKHMIAIAMLCFLYQQSRPSFIPRPLHGEVGLESLLYQTCSTATIHYSGSSQLRLWYASNAIGTLQSHSSATTIMSTIMWCTNYIASIPHAILTSAAILAVELVWYNDSRPPSLCSGLGTGLEQGHSS